jgi:hypothetical protein
LVIVSFRSSTAIPPGAALDQQEQEQEQEVVGQEVVPPGVSTTLDGIEQVEPI